MIPPEPNILDRLLTAIRQIIRQELPRLSYLGTWEYAVTGVNADHTVNCTSSDASAPLPNLNNVPIRSGPEGGTGTPTAGHFCYVRFVNSDPTRPVIVGNAALVKTATLDATDTVAVGSSVSNAVILAGGNAPVARSGDAVTVYFGASPLAIIGTLTPPLPTVPGTFVGTLLIPTPATGVITTGQPKVLA